MTASSRLLTAFSQLRIVFGHQSVGENIIEGLTSWAKADDVALRVTSPDQAPGDGGVLVHARVGRNCEPASKIEAFGPLVDDAAARGPVDVALLKFCYIDIDERTDVEALFAAYRDGLARVAARHPRTRVVPVTAPLRHSAGGAGVWIREVLGRPNHSKLANLARHRFNARVRDHWAGQAIVDIAAAEASRPDGTTETVSAGGVAIEHLRAAFTDDGGHLNAAGRRVVAEALVGALVR